MSSPLGDDQATRPSTTDGVGQFVATALFGALRTIRSACEHTFVTSDGSPYTRFRRALDTGNAALVIAAARDLPQIALDDALRICLILRDADPERYERAAVRWLGRFALEARGVTIGTLRVAAEAFDRLPDRATDAMEQLQALCMAHGIRYR